MLGLKNGAKTNLKRSLAHAAQICYRLDKHFTGGPKAETVLHVS
jgi:hypothetical protein